MENLPALRLPEELVVPNPEIEQPLRDGHRMKAFSTRDGLRVVRTESTEGELVGYGEAPQVEEALEHAALDYRLGRETYAQQYSGEGARYPYHVTGASESSSLLDDHLRRHATFDAHKATDSDEIVVSLAGIQFSPEVPDGLRARVTSTMEAETFEERGITYQAQPCQILGNGEQGIVIEAIANPGNVSPSFYHYTKTGEGQTFAEAVAAAFEAPETEIMQPFGYSQGE